MTKILSLILALVLATALAIPASAVSTVQNANQCVKILSASEGVEESTVYKMYHLQEEQMMEIINASIEAEEEIVPENAGVKHVTMIRQKDVVCDTDPIEYSIQIMSAIDRYIFIFFKGIEDEEWSLVACQFGEFMDFALPGSGQYAIAWSW